MPAAVGQLLAGEADALEFLLTPDMLRQVRAAPHLTTHPYGGSVYTYLAFNLRANGDTTRPHPLFSDREVRRALFLATDRERLRQSTFGDVAKVPPGPLVLMWRQLWELDARPLPYDSARAARLLDQRGWRDSDGDGIRDKDGVKLSFRLAAPTTSAARRQYAQLLQAQYRAFGAEVQIEEFEPSVLDERGRRGRFDAALASWSTDPAPLSSMAQAWTSGGIGGTNWGRYVNPEVEQLIERVAAAPAAERRRLWESVLRVLNDDAAGIWLYSIQNIAAVHARVADVRLRADTWWTYVRDWRIPPDRLIDRDRVGR